MLDYLGKTVCVVMDRPFVHPIQNMDLNILLIMDIFLIRFQVMENN